MADKEAAPISTLSYLGTRIMVLDGDFVARLLADGKASQVTFLVGREIGALKARLTRLDIWVVLLNAVNALRIMAPFLTPYYRATTYSGDQIGMVCAGDFDATLEATRRLLVGDKLAASLGDGVVVPQALLVRRRLLPRFGQLFLAEPHITNRYANLLCFARSQDPAAWERVAARLSEHEAAAFEELWRRSPYSRRSGPEASLGGVVAGPPTPEPASTAATMEPDSTPAVESPRLPYAPQAPRSVKPSHVVVGLVALAVILGAIAAIVVTTRGGSDETAPPVEAGAPATTGGQRRHRQRGAGT